LVVVKKGVQVSVISPQKNLVLVARTEKITKSTY